MGKILYDHYRLVPLFKLVVSTSHLSYYGKQWCSETFIVKFSTSNDVSTSHLSYQGKQWCSETFMVKFSTNNVRWNAIG